MDALRFEHVSKAFGDRWIFRDLSFALPCGRITALSAPSGFGKTTLLRMLAGLELPTSGTVRGSRPQKTAYVFQEPRLFPAAAWQNIACVLAGSKEQRRTEALEWLRRVGLAEDAEKRPSQLSGGMQARVALARGLASLAAGREILLLDEPFSGVDASCKAELIPLIRREAAGKTVVLVTHDAEEIAALADSVLALP